METNWIRVEYSPRTFVIADSSKSRMICESETLFLKKFTDRIIFMSMFNDIDCTRKGNDGICASNSQKSGKYAKRFSVLETRRSGMELFLTPEGKWDSTATQMVERFKGNGHPVFKNISALSRGILKQKSGRDTVNFNADASNTELFFRIIHSVNQLSIYGAVSNWCEQFCWTEEEKVKEKPPGKKVCWQVWNDKK